MWEATNNRAAVSDEHLADSLRAWARGSYRCEAAVELVIRAVGGRLLHGPWVHTRQGGEGWYLDATPMLDAGYLSGGELRVLLVVASLLSWQCPVDLGDVCSVDRDALRLVLAALAHAGGSHEHSEPTFSDEGEWLGTFRAAPLVTWPETAGAAGVGGAMGGGAR